MFKIVLNSTYFLHFNFPTEDFEIEIVICAKKVV